EVAGEILQDLRGVLAQEHLAAASLPAQVVDVIDVADQVGLFEPHQVPVFVRLQWEVSTRTASAAGAFSSRTGATRVPMRSSPERRRIQPVSPPISRVRGAPWGAPALTRLSAAAQTRVAAAPNVSPR